MVFTRLNEGDNIYPNRVEAENVSEAIREVLSKREGHTAVGTSHLSFPSDVERFTAITTVIAPTTEWKTGRYLNLE